jgi:hypothetical protein
MDALLQLRNQVETQAAHVRRLKAEGKAKDALQIDIQRLQELKAGLAEMEKKMAELTTEDKKFDRAAFEELMKRRFYYFPSFNIYGGVNKERRIFFRKSVN